MKRVQARLPLVDRQEAVVEFFRNEDGQMLAEYSILMWFFTLVGVATLGTFIFAVEESVVDWYADIVNVICLPLP